MNDGNFKSGMVGFTDTGQWRLVIAISFSGMTAYFRNVMDLSMDPIAFLNKEWQADEDNLLGLVEEAVYDNPRILDDFATQIILYTSKSLWIPEELTDEDEFDEKYFTSVYNVAAEDIFADFGDEEVCLYSMAPGLNSFLQRTVPGCKITSHLTILKKTFSDLEREACLMYPHYQNSIYLNCRDSETDFFAFGKKKFLSGSTHQWRNFNDLIYQALLLANVYKLNPRETRLYIMGAEGLAEGLDHDIRPFFPLNAVIRMPAFSEKYNIPVAAALASNENFENQ